MATVRDPARLNMHKVENDFKTKINRAASVLINFQGSQKSIESDPDPSQGSWKSTRIIDSHANDPCI